MRRTPWIAAFGLSLTAVLGLRFGNDALRACEDRAPSRSLGTPAAGSLENGRRLPTAGPNFRPYAYLGALLGRNAVHGQVRDLVAAAYDRLDETHPELKFVYGETGWPGGGPFPPHRTHQNGLSVDFMTPVRDARGRSVRLPRGPFRKFGYAVEFDEVGVLGDLTIDYAAIGLHIDALLDLAGEHGLVLERVIFDPALQPWLFATPEGAALIGRVAFSTQRAWVRHDEHYHVDFLVVGAPP